MVMTVMSVATPIVSPSIVSEARSLCARKALKHCTRLSRAASISLEKTPTHFTDSFARAPPARGRQGGGHYVNTRKGGGDLPPGRNAPPFRRVYKTRKSGVFFAATYCLRTFSGVKQKKTLLYRVLYPRLK